MNPAELCISQFVQNEHADDLGVMPVSLEGTVVGSMCSMQGSRYCVLTNIHPADGSLSRTAQARQIFKRMETALKSVDMSFSNVVRTWFFIDEILAWYEDFNKVRTEFFNEHRVFDGLVPASTGVGLSSSGVSAITANAIAVQPGNSNVRVNSVKSPLQCSASDYRSSFSRAVELSWHDSRKLYISGTASIAPDGATVHAGDPDKQIALTMDVVKALLKSRAMEWSDTTRAIAYFSDMKDVTRFDTYREKTQLTMLPVTMTHADICRKELLFEIELDAVSDKTMLKTLV